MPSFSTTRDASCPGSSPRTPRTARVVRLAWERLLTGFPLEENGLPTWLTYCCFDGQTLAGRELAPQPRLVSTPASPSGAAAYHAFSGDRRVIDFVRRVLDYQLANGTTPADPAWAWPAVPYASADHGAVRAIGARTTSGTPRRQRSRAASSGGATATASSSPTRSASSASRISPSGS